MKKKKLSCAPNDLLISSSSADQISSTSSSSSAVSGSSTTGISSSVSTFSTNSSCSSIISNISSCVDNRISATSTGTITNGSNSQPQSLAMNGGSCSQEQLQQLISVEVALAMERFYGVHGQALAKLEQLIMGEVLPLLRRPRRRHEQLLNKLTRRLNKLRPNAVRIRAGLQCHASHNGQQHGRCQDRQDRHTQERNQRGSQYLLKRRMHRQQQFSDLASASCTRFISGLIGGSDSESSVHDSEQRLLSQSRAQSQAQTRSLLREVSHSLLQADLRREQEGETKSKDWHKAIKFIYQNSTFCSVPVSDHSEAYLLRADQESARANRRQTASMVCDSTEWQTINRKQLKTNLLFNKSSYSLFMNRFKYPVPWTRAYDYWCSPKKPSKPVSWQDNP